MVSDRSILDPSDLEFLQQTYQEIKAEIWFTDDEAAARRFAEALLHFYQQLYSLTPEKFAAFARSHAKQNFRRRVQFDEDIAG